jgi:hypothetical protein
MERPGGQQRQRFSRPTIVAVMGQAGSGKTTLASVMPERLGVIDPYVVDADDFDRLHPSFTALREAYGETEAREVIGETESSNRIFERALDFGLRQGYNLAVAGPMTNPEWVATTFARWRNDYDARIHVAALAVHEARSLLGTVDRFRQQIETTGHGRWVDQEWHDLQYPGLLRSVQRIEAEGLADSVTCVARGGRTVYDNVLITTSPGVVWRDPPRAQAAIEGERSRLWTDREHADFYRRAMAVDRFSRNSQWTPEQAETAADALRCGLAPNSQAIAALRRRASQATSSQSASILHQQADQREQYNQQISAAADRLDAMALTRQAGPAAAARAAALGMPAGIGRSTSNSPGVGPGSEPASRPPSRPSGPEATPGR